MTPNLSSTNTSEAMSTAPSQDAGRPTRRRWSKEQKCDLLARFAARGTSAAEFCRQMGLSAATFSTWCRLSAVSDAGEVPSVDGFAQVRVSAATDRGGAGTTALVIAQLPGGISLAVPPGTDPIWLGRVLQSARVE